jgi:hypothetical protein
MVVHSTKPRSELLRRPLSRRSMRRIQLRGSTPTLRMLAKSSSTSGRSSDGMSLCSRAMRRGTSPGEAAKPDVQPAGRLD